MTAAEEIAEAMERGMSLMFIEGFLAEWKRDPVGLRAAFEQAATTVREKREVEILDELQRYRRKDRWK